MTDTTPHANAAESARALPPSDSGLAPVILSKVQAPALRADTLSRGRLVRRLDDALKSRVVLVIADAGYGKTTLLTDYVARSAFRSLWYRLSQSDADPTTWANYLVASCRQVDPTFGSVTTGLLADSSAGRLPASTFIDSFLGELNRWPSAPTLLVLDDFQETDNNVEVAEIVGRLIDDAPSWLHLVISARRRPHLAFGKLAAAAELSELRTDDLRFTPAETRQLFAEGYSEPLDDDVVEQLDRRTRGWAASLQLFHGSIRGRPGPEIRRLAGALSGASGAVYDFLAEEVLATVPQDLADFLVRSSLLDRLVDRDVAALFDGTTTPEIAVVRSWIAEAVRRGLLGRSSDERETYEFHPLLRDFLTRQLENRLGHSEIKTLHRQLAEALRDSDMLSACHHYIEAGLESKAMDLLGGSVLSTLGSGQWGVATSLMDRLMSVPAGPAIAAIRARHLISSGNPAAAARLLGGVDIESCPADVRAVLRQTWFSIAFRTGDRDLIRSTITDLVGDPETPHALREFAQILIDSGAISTDEAKPLPQLGRRLMDLADHEQLAGHWFYSGVCAHNACIAFLNAADYPSAINAGESALAAFMRLGYEPAEASSTRSALATTLYEAGRTTEGQQFVEKALTDTALADVPAELAILHATLGHRAVAQTYIDQAEALGRLGRTDIGAAPLVPVAKAVVALPEDADEAVALLSPRSDEETLYLGQLLLRRVQLAAAFALLGNAEECLRLAVPALATARRGRERRAEVRLALIIAIANSDADAIHAAIDEADSISKLALAELADVVCGAGSLLPTNSETLRSAIQAHPARWLPALRRTLGTGAPNGLQAAILLDRHGEAEDVTRLRAFSKAYRTRGASPDLGIALSKRTSPRLTINDLGRVELRVGARDVLLSGMRRKAAALLMYLATQPHFTANKEQVLDELWPDVDPSSATNSLNQSLYFLRREIDPWYEDDVSPDYVHFSGDLLWLDPILVSTASSDFLKAAAGVRNRTTGDSMAVELIRTYRDHFAPEFEYEDWAIDWRSKVHSVLLELAYAAMERLIARGENSVAREVATAVLDIDPTAAEIERRLIRLLWSSGASSAARAQYAHLARLESRDGLESETFESLVSS